MDYEDIIPEGLKEKTEVERQEIIKRWEHLHDLKQTILEGKMPEEQHRLPEIEKELSQVSKQLAPREPMPESGILFKNGKQYILCPRCGTFVHITKDRIVKLALEFKEAPEVERTRDKYLIRSITCPICKWGLGLPEERESAQS